MKPAVVVLLLWNTLALLPVVFHLLGWIGILPVARYLFGSGSTFDTLVRDLLISRVLYGIDVPLPLGVLLFMIGLAGIALFIASVLATIRLKIRILRRYGSMSAEVRGIYRGATQISILFYLLYHPIILISALSRPVHSELVGYIVLFWLFAVAILSAPVFLEVRKLKRLSEPLFASLPEPPSPAASSGR